MYDSSTKPTQQPASSRHALHPLWGTTPVTSRYTRYQALHPLRGAAPDQKRCNARGSGAAPLPTNTFTAIRSRHTPSDGHTATAGSRRSNRLHPGMRYTRYGALHPLRRTAPVTGHYTRSEEVQCPRIGCSATPGKYRRGHAIQVSPRKHSRCLRSETPPLRTRLSQASLATHCPLTSESRTRWSASGNISLIRRACATSPCFHSALYR